MVASFWLCDIVATLLNIFYDVKRFFFIFTAMLKTINTKFIFFTIVFILLSVGVPTTFLILQLRENFDQRSKVMLESTVDVVHNCLINAMRMGKQKQVQTILDNIANNESVDHIRIFNEKGIISFSSSHEEIGSNLNIIAPGHTNLNAINEKKVILLEDERSYSVTSPILNRTDCQSCHGTGEYIAYLDVDTNLTKAEVNFHTGYLHMIFLAGAIIIILFLGFYYLFNFFINKPLNRFKKALDDVEKGDLNTRLPSEKPDEMGLLEKHFNHMVINLKESKQKIDELHFEQLQRADKLVTLGELAAEMAHEINNPAGIIMSRADYIQMDIDQNPGLKKYNEDLEVMINQVSKISKITGSILKYSKKLPKEFHRIDLKKISEESLNILGPRLAKKGIDVERIYDSDKTEIKGDSTQMEQVMTNLVNNAIDAIDKKGKIIIGIREVDAERILWYINDSGSGMDKNTQEQIFSPFFTTKSADKGTGLGLYIVRNICKNHNAEVECESNPGEGTTFNIIFPTIKESHG